MKTLEEVLIELTKFCGEAFTYPDAAITLEVRIKDGKPRWHVELPDMSRIAGFRTDEDGSDTPVEAVEQALRRDVVAMVESADLADRRHGRAHDRARAVRELLEAPDAPGATP